MADDPAALAAEIAAHRPAERCGICHKSAKGETCDECGEPWPCLVRRLADLLLASEGVLIDAPALVVRERERADALMAALLRYGVHLHYACELQDVCECGLDAARALAPADGEN